MGLIVERFLRVLNNPTKYIIQNPQTSEALKHFSDCIMKFESFYNKLIFQKDTSPRHDRTESINAPLSHRSVSFDLGNTSMVNESINMDSYSINSKLSTIIEELNIGNFIPLKCGHMGIFSPDELELYQLLLFQANFIS